MYQCYIQYKEKTKYYYNQYCYQQLNIYLWFKSILYKDFVNSLYGLIRLYILLNMVIVYIFGKLKKYIYANSNNTQQIPFNIK